MKYENIIEQLNNLDSKARQGYAELYALYSVDKEGRITEPYNKQDEPIMRTLSNKTFPLLKEAEKGFWLWKKNGYELTNYGSEFLRKEMRNTKEIRDTLSGTGNIEGKISAVMESHNTSTIDYFVKKMILTEHIFDDSAYDVFIKEKKLGDYMKKKLDALDKDKKYSDKFSTTFPTATDDAVLYGLLAYSIISIPSVPVVQPVHRGDSRHSSSSSGCSGGTEWISSSISGCSGGSSGCSGGCGGGCGGGGCGGGGCGGG